MFFIGIISILSKEKKLDFSQSIMCPICGHFGRYEVYVKYNELSLFFIPLLKFGKEYIAVSTCCKSIYGITKECGKEIENKTKLSLDENDLTPLNINLEIFCPACGYKLSKDFEFCPKCGRKID